ncbi:hypothetical protein ACIBCT_31460 [Streptosporangium sp. NPDC050855]|uniref:hypothetical protein n=1 Tax=Streptosporangium sp. NPDC050855 TaxID=3366194 RepID=UPI0037A7C951
MATHKTAAPPDMQAGHGTALWWTILIMGTTVSVILNLWHALSLTSQQTLDTAKAAGKSAAEVGSGHPVLGIIFALVPAVFAALLSHGLVSPMAAKWFRAAILALFGISMLTSISSQAAVMRPYGGGYGAEWSIPLVLDASALLALHFITKAATATREAIIWEQQEAELAVMKAELRPIVEAELRTELEAEVQARRTELEAEAARIREAELEAVRAEVQAELGAKLQASQDEMEAALAAREAELDTQFAALMAQAETQLRQDAEIEMQQRLRRAEVETEARVRLELTAHAKPKTRAKTAKTPAKKTAHDGLSAKDRARILLTDNPGITGTELGRALNVSDRYGRQLLEQLLEENAATADVSGPEVVLRAVN